MLAVGKGAVYVDTGDPIPDGFNAVIMIEDVNPRMSISTKWQAGMREAKVWWQHLCGRKHIMFSRKLFI